MPIWSQILDEQRRTLQPNGAPDFDSVRRKYLRACQEHTTRNTILFASAWIQKPQLGFGTIIADDDVQGLMEAVHGLTGDRLDLILHSPGGSPAAAEGIVLYLRSKFSDIRVIVPHMAMSAATMIACAADRIVMGKHSFLGPTDPQFQTGDTVAAAYNILSDFDRALRECAADSNNVLAWQLLLNRYTPGLLSQCEVSVDLSKELVRRWLSEYMFQGEPDNSKADDIAEWLSQHAHHKSHGRHISSEELREMGLVVDELEADPELQDLVLSVYHATTLTFAQTAAGKIIENDRGRAYVKMIPNAHPVPPTEGPQDPPGSTRSKRSRRWPPFRRRSE